MEGKKWSNGAHAQGKDQEGKAIKWMCDYFNSTWCNIWWEWNEPNVTWLYPLPNSPQTPPILNFVEKITQLQKRLNRLQELRNQLQVLEVWFFHIWMLNQRMKQLWLQ